MCCFIKAGFNPIYYRFDHILVFETSFINEFRVSEWQVKNVSHLRCFEFKAFWRFVTALFFVYPFKHFRQLPDLLLWFYVLEDLRSFSDDFSFWDLSQRIIQDFMIRLDIKFFYWFFKCDFRVCSLHFLNMFFHSLLLNLLYIGSLHFFLVF